jgi:hypothetical protein
VLAACLDTFEAAYFADQDSVDRFTSEMELARAALARLEDDKQAALGAWSAAEVRCEALTAALLYWVDRADHWTSPSSTSVLTPEYKLGRALATSEQAADELRSE